MKVESCLGIADERRLPSLPTFLAWVTVLALVACAQTPPFPPVPTPQEEVVPAPPVSSTQLIWQPGHYDWDGSQYIWTKGQWTEKTGNSTLWQDGYWQKQGDQYVWVPGHWM
jgi:hypothetical protein